MNDANEKTMHHTKPWAYIAPGESDVSETTEFERELASVINRHSLENESNTPDFILAEYLRSCLRAFTMASRTREAWYGKGLKP